MAQGALTAVVIKRNLANAPGQNTGIGIGFQKIGDAASAYTITDIVAGGAAELTGKIRVGTLLHGVDQWSVTTATPAQVKQLIVGPPGTDVCLWVSEPAEEEKPNPVDRMFVAERMNLSEPQFIDKGPRFCDTQRKFTNEKNSVASLPVPAKPAPAPAPAPTSTSAPAPQPVPAPAPIPVPEITPQAPEPAVRQLSLVRGPTGGLGLGFYKPNGPGNPWVTDLNPNGAAYASRSIEAGDVILAVGGYQTANLAAEQITGLIVGQPGSTVNITLRSSMQQLTLTRGPTGGLGLGISRAQSGGGGGPFVVRVLVDGGAAAQSMRFAVGDLLHEVSGISVHNKSLEQVTALITGQPGTPVSLKYYSPTAGERAKILAAVGSETANRMSVAPESRMSPEPGRMTPAPALQSAPVRAPATHLQQQPPGLMVINLTRGPTGGIGLGLIRTTAEGPYMVNNLVPNGSAAVSKALVVGDLVYGVNGYSTQRASFEQVKAQIVGQPGSQCTIAFQRPQMQEAPAGLRALQSEGGLLEPTLVPGMQAPVAPPKQMQAAAPMQQQQQVMVQQPIQTWQPSPSAADITRAAVQERERSSSPVFGEAD